MRPSLSALIIARDEARDLPGCLASLKGTADEIVVLVDDATTDDTERIARDAGCVVARRKFDDYTRQRQAALDLCTKDWVLWIDADERLVELPTPPDGAVGVPLRFRVRFLGKVLRFGGLGGETHVRLFARKAAKFVGGQVHEGLALDGRVAAPAGLIDHEPYQDLDEYFAKTRRYTSLAAEKKLAAGKSASVLHHLVFPWELLKRLVLRLGVLDGYPGVMWAGLSAYHHWLKYAKLRELEASRKR